MGTGSAISISNIRAMRGDLLHQRGGDLSVEMRVASSLVVEGIEYRERGWSFLYRIS